MVLTERWFEACPFQIRSCFLILVLLCVFLLCLGGGEPQLLSIYYKYNLVQMQKSLQSLC